MEIVGHKISVHLGDKKLIGFHSQGEYFFTLETITGAVDSSPKRLIELAGSERPSFLQEEEEAIITIEEACDCWTLLAIYDGNIEASRLLSACAANCLKLTSDSAYYKAFKESDILEVEVSVRDRPIWELPKKERRTKFYYPLKSSRKIEVTLIEP